jgi:hypothetical protein
MIAKQFPEKQLRKQLDKAERLGWVQSCKDAGAQFNIEPALLLAIGSRETNLDERYLRVAGDGGNGYGLTQADKRYRPEFVTSGKWKEARECFLLTADMLRHALDEVAGWEGKTIKGRFRSGQEFQFVCPKLTDEQRLQIVIAGYNCGTPTAAYHLSQGRGPDHGTTGKNYSADVLYRKEFFEKQRDGLLKSVATAAAVGAGVAATAAVAQAADDSFSLASVGEIVDDKTVEVVEKVAEKGSTVKNVLKKVGTSVANAYFTVEGFIRDASWGQRIALIVVISVITYLVIHYRRQILAGIKSLKGKKQQ